MDFQLAGMLTWALLALASVYLHHSELIGVYYSHTSQLETLTSQCLFLELVSFLSTVGLNLLAAVISSNMISSNYR